MKLETSRTCFGKSFTRGLVSSIQSLKANSVLMPVDKSRISSFDSSQKSVAGLSSEPSAEALLLAFPISTCSSVPTLGAWRTNVCTCFEKEQYVYMSDTQYAYMSDNHSYIRVCRLLHQQEITSIDIARVLHYWGALSMSLVRAVTTACMH